MNEYLATENGGCLCMTIHIALTAQWWDTYKPRWRLIEQVCQGVSEKQS